MRWFWGLTIGYAVLYAVFPLGGQFLGLLQLACVVPAACLAMRMSSDFRTAVHDRKLPGRRGFFALAMALILSVSIFVGFAAVFHGMSETYAGPVEAVQRSAAAGAAVPAKPLNLDGVLAILRALAGIILIVGPVIWQFGGRRRRDDTGQVPRWPLLVGPVCGVFLTMAFAYAVDRLGSAMGQSTFDAAALALVDAVFGAPYIAYIVGPFAGLWTQAVTARGGQPFDANLSYRWALKGFMAFAWVAILLGMPLLVAGSTMSPGLFRTGGQVQLLVMIAVLAFSVYCLRPLLSGAPDSIVQGWVVLAVNGFGLVAMLLVPAMLDQSPEWWMITILLFCPLLIGTGVLLKVLTSTTSRWLVAR